MADSRKTKKGHVAEVRTSQSRKPKLERVSPRIARRKKPEAKRKTGIDILGDVPWGTHFCLFYQSKQDLIDILVPYFKAGLENNEFCMWVTSEPLSGKEAEKAARKTLPDFDGYLKAGQIEIVPHNKWYLKDGSFDLRRVLNAWIDKLDWALAKDYDGIRVTGNMGWLEKKDWKKFADYEAEVNNAIGKYRMLAICTYCLDKCAAPEVIDVVSSHQFALIRQEGDWRIIESSEHKKVEEALRETRDYLEKLVDHSNVPVIVWDPKFRVTRFNRAFERLTGYTADEVIGHKLTILFPKATREESLKNIKRTLSGEYWKSVEIPILCKNKQVRLALWNSANIYDEDGTTLLATIAQGQDITERKKAEEKLRNERNRLIGVFEAMEDGVYIVNQQHDIQYVNPVLEKDFGPWQGRKCYTYFHDRKEVCPWCRNDDVFAGKTVRWEWYSFKNQKTYDLIDTPLRNPDGSISKLEIFRDITEFKQMEQRERERQAEVAHCARLSTIGEMASALAHELNQPLCAIASHAKGALRMMKSGGWDSDELLDAMEEAGTQAERAGEIIRRMTRLVHKKGPHRSSVNIENVIDEAISLIEHEARLRGTTIRQVELSEKPPMLGVDRIQIEQVLVNLLRNSFEAMDSINKSKRRITIEVSTDENDTVQVAVSDAGKGFPAENIERIFEPFFTTKSQGLGIGLSISRSIIEAHGGRIWAEHNRAGGATFRFTLPTGKETS